jgi:hypothetical protein
MSKKIKIIVLGVIVLSSFAAGMETGVKMRSPLCPSPGLTEAIHQVTGVCQPCPDEAAAKRRAEQLEFMRHIPEHPADGVNEIIDNWNWEPQDATAPPQKQGKKR